MVHEDYEARHHEPLNTDSLTDLEASRLVMELHDTFKAFAVRPIDAWPLSVRASNILRRNKLLCVYDLQSLDKKGILRLDKCGLKSLSEIFQTAREQGFELPNFLDALAEKYESVFKGSRDRKNEKAREKRLNEDS